LLYRGTGWVSESIFFYSSFRRCIVGYDALLFALYTYQEKKQIIPALLLLVLHMYVSDDRNVYFVDHLLALATGYLVGECAWFLHHVLRSNRSSFTV
jgi:hypothetical protein